MGLSRFPTGTSRASSDSSNVPISLFSQLSHHHGTPVVPHALLGEVNEEVKPDRRKVPISDTLLRLGWTELELFGIRS